MRVQVEQRVTGETQRNTFWEFKGEVLCLCSSNKKSVSPEISECLWIGWIQEVPGVTCQERSRQALMERLAVTLEEILEIRPEATRSAAGDGYETAKVSIA